MQITSKAIAQTRPAFSRASLSFTFLAFVALLWMQTLAAAARGAPATFADLVEQVGGAVVNITTTTKMATWLHECLITSVLGWFGPHCCSATPTELR